MTKREEFDNTKAFEKVKENLMNEEELNIKELEKEYSYLRSNGFDEPRQEEIRNMIYYFQKGKLQQMKEFEHFIQDILDWAYVNRDTETGDVPYEELNKYICLKRKKQIGGVKGK